jgi:hypothetical protein
MGRGFTLASRQDWGVRLRILQEFLQAVWSAVSLTNSIKEIEVVGWVRCQPESQPI